MAKTMNKAPVDHERSMREQIEAGEWVQVRIPADPLNRGDDVVPVGINGCFWNIPRGENTKVPAAVAALLALGKYI